MSISADAKCSVDFVALHARLSPGRVVARELATERSWTWSEFDSLIAKCADVLCHAGVKAGDRIGALAKNCMELVVLSLAASRTGSIFVPYNWRLSANELRVLIADSEPAIVFGDSLLAQNGIDGCTLDELNEKIEHADAISALTADPDRPSLILYTSGTSGVPKGALLTERNLTETAINFSLLGKVDSDSVVLCDAPLFHVIGLVSNIRPVLMRGGTFVISDGFDPGRTLARLADPELGITHYFCVPQMASALRNDPAYTPASLNNLTALFTGGAPHPADDIRRWLSDGVIVADGFGMSEAGTVFGMPLDPDLISTHAGAAGLPTPRVSARIVDTDGRDCATGESGELLLQGENLLREYWRRPAETEAAFVDGWFRTGDVARVDEDGYFWLVDRLKDLYISGGENVYPAEIEATLASFDSIRECAVVGVPDDRWGEVGHLFLVVTTENENIHAEVTEHFAGRLARYKIPKHITVIDALPRNGAGKVLKNVLRKLSSEKMS